MRRLIMSRLIWIYTVCKSTYFCLQGCKSSLAYIHVSIYLTLSFKLRGSNTLSRDITSSKSFYTLTLYGRVFFLFSNGYILKEKTGIHSLSDGVSVQKNKQEVINAGFLVENGGKFIKCVRLPKGSNPLNVHEAWLRLFFFFFFFFFGGGRGGGGGGGGGGRVKKKLPRVISVCHIYITYFNIRKGHFSQNKLCLFQTYICATNN